MIEVRNLSFRYSGARNYALQRASFSADPTGTTAIVGRSGVGKSTFMALMSGIYTDRDEIVGEIEGQITLDGRRPEELRGPDTISWVPQQPALLDHLTIAQNVLLPLSIGGVSAQAAADCMRLLAALGLKERQAARPRELSGGMRTRISIARALISRPTYLFLDEPFTSLDIDNRWDLYRLLVAERRDQGFRTFLTTHDIPEALLLADRLVVLGRSEGATSVDVVANSPLDLDNGSLSDLLAEARDRAQVIEARIYSK